MHIKLISQKTHSKNIKIKCLSLMKNKTAIQRMRTPFQTCYCQPQQNKYNGHIFVYFITIIIQFMITVIYYIENMRNHLTNRTKIIQYFTKKMGSIMSVRKQVKFAHILLRGRQKQQRHILMRQYVRIGIYRGYTRRILTNILFIAKRPNMAFATSSIIYSKNPVNAILTKIQILQ